MFEVCAIVWSHVDVHRLCCCWRPCWSERPKAMVMSKIQAASESLVWVHGPTAAEAVFVVCAVVRNRVEARDLCSYWLQCPPFILFFINLNSLFLTNFTKGYQFCSSFWRNNSSFHCILVLPFHFCFINFCNHLVISYFSLCTDFWFSLFFLLCLKKHHKVVYLKFIWFLKNILI